MVIIVRGRVLVLCLLTIHPNELERRDTLVGPGGGELGTTGQLALVEQPGGNLHDLVRGGEWVCVCVWLLLPSNQSFIG